MAIQGLIWWIENTFMSPMKLWCLQLEDSGSHVGSFILFIIPNTYIQALRVLN